MVRVLEAKLNIMILNTDDFLRIIKQPKPVDPRYLSVLKIFADCPAQHPEFVPYSVKIEIDHLRKTLESDPRIKSITFEHSEYGHELTLVSMNKKYTSNELIDYTPGIK